VEPKWVCDLEVEVYASFWDWPEWVAEKITNHELALRHRLEVANRASYEFEAQHNVEPSSFL
jgi:hypothetical protein